MKLAQLFLEKAGEQKGSELSHMIFQSSKNSKENRKKGDVLNKQFPHIVNYINSQVWAILPSHLELIQSIVTTHMHGEPDIASIEAAMGRRLDNNPEVQLQGQTAIIPIYGAIVDKGSLMAQSSGALSAEKIQGMIQSALDNPDVKNILLDVNSPGGTVTGGMELSDFIYAARDIKPIDAFVSGNMASLAYLIGSSASTVTATETSLSGSIGTIMTHQDFSKRLEMDGIKITHITSGENKAMGNSAEPLSEKAHQHFKGLVDEFNAMFVERVARNRKVSVMDVMNNMGQGKMYIAKEALSRKMIDKIGTMDMALSGGSNIFAEGQDLTVSASAESLTIEAFTHNSKTAESEPEWGTVDKTKLPRAAFSAGDPDKKSSWSYPHHHIVGGSKLDKNGCYMDGTMFLSKSGLNAAWAASQGARSGQKASPEIISHLEAHRKALGLDKEKPKKEVRNMDLQELKETHPELVKAIAEEAKSPLAQENGKLVEAISGLTAKATELEASNKELTKFLALEKAKGTQAQAEGIKNGILAGSSIPDAFHDKVSGMVGHNAHLNAEGSLNVESFTAAFTTEVKDWETRLSGTAIQGAGVADSRVDASTKDKVDMALVNQVMGM